MAATEAGAARASEPRPISDTTTHGNLTGSWRYIRPLYHDGVAPCAATCPVGTDVQGYLRFAQRGRLEEALQLLLMENPMPAITGRVCPHPCETSCNRAPLDGSVSIHAIERALGDLALEEPPPPPAPRSRDERVAVIGSGPAGLACAYHLRRMGYGVTVLEQEERAGGILRYGIPEYRLPVTVLDATIAWIRSQGVELRTGQRVLPGDGRLPGYDAIFLATGAPLSRSLGVPGEDGPGVMAGLAFLRQVRRGRHPDLRGSEVVVVGGGNTAIDCARTAARLGARVLIAYRRTRAEMPAIASEIDDAVREGVDLRFLASPGGVARHAGRVVGLELVPMRLGEADDSGRRTPVALEHGRFSVRADLVLTATGEVIDPEGVPRELAGNGAIPVDAGGATVRPGLFAGGDVAGDQRTVAHALGAGKRAAITIDAWLRRPGRAGAAAEQRKEAREPSRRSEELLASVRFGSGNASMARWRELDPVSRRDPVNVVVGGERINLAHFRRVRRAEDRHLPAEQPSFQEANLGLELADAFAEAGRCLGCGACDDCEVCLIVCPDAAIRRLPNGGFEVDLDHCKGCGLCVVECPRGAVAMAREDA